MTMMMESSDSSSPSSMADLILLVRNLITPLFISADKSLLFLSHKSKLLNLLRWLLFSLFFLLFHLLRSLPFSLSSRKYKATDDSIITAANHTHKATGNDSAISRALQQVLSLVSEIPVSSRKYDVVRSLVEKLIDENLKENSPALREVNCAALCSAFSSTMARLQDLLLVRSSGGGSWLVLGPVRAVGLIRRWCTTAGQGGELNDSGGLAEKMAAELLWLARKLEESGGVATAVENWAKATNLGWLASMGEPRVQASILKLTVFLIKQAKEMDGNEETEKQKQTKLKMLMTWLPLLCRASNGADGPILSSSERREIERTLEGMIDMIQEEGNREKVLSLWLHQFTQCSSSDWPNLYGSYHRWCTSSRKLLLMQ